MSKKPRSYSADFKQEAVRRMGQATTIIGLAKELGIRRKLLYQWRDQLRAGGKAGEQRRIVPAMAARSLSRHRSLALVRRSKSDRGTAMPGSRGKPSGVLSLFAADCAREFQDGRNNPKCV